jgi:hypothetical protein
MRFILEFKMNIKFFGNELEILANQCSQIVSSQKVNTNCHT